MRQRAPRAKRCGLSRPPGMPLPAEARLPPAGAELPRLGYLARGDVVRRCDDLSG
ncbi:hypothetical protein [Mycobacterium sp. HNNTM2301]|uniref:hypothetical protein n=1 Tax=Mycobacterium hainanense TaxID=3289775 RepID=UPI0035A73EC1